MTTEFTSYTRGYRDALNNMDKLITNSIRANGNVTKAQDAVNVMNDTIYFLHQELASVAQHGIEEVEPHMSESEIDDVLNHAFGIAQKELEQAGIKLHVIKGGN